MALVVIESAELEQLLERAVERVLARSGDEVLSSEEAARVAKVSPKTIAAWCRTGRLNAGAPPYRIRRSALMAAVGWRPPGPPAGPASSRDPEVLAEKALAKLRGEP